MLFWYLLFGVVILFYSGLSSDVFGRSLHKYFNQYFSCETVGNTTNNECLDKYNEIQQLSFPALLVVVMLFLGSVPVVNLIFVVNWKYLKHLCMILMPRHQQTDADNEQDSSPTVLTYQKISS